MGKTTGIRNKEENPEDTMLLIIHRKVTISVSTSIYWATSHTKVSLVAQQYRICLPMQETQFWPLGWEDCLEREMAAYSSILAWKIPWTEEPGGL